MSEKVVEALNQLSESIAERIRDIQKESSIKTLEKLSEIGEALKSLQSSFQKESEGKTLEIAEYLDQVAMPHVKGCPTCQKVLEKHGFIKFVKKEKPEIWSVSDIFKKKEEEFKE